jgi:hypothetical protein
MYAATNRPSPTLPSPEGACRSRADGWSPASWTCAYLRGRDARHPASCPPRAPWSPMPSRNRLAVRPVLGVAAGWFADPLDDRVFAPSGPKPGVKVRLETVADGLPAPLTRIPEAERPSPRR